MKERIAAKRYADAFVAYAAETAELSALVEDFKNLGRIFSDNPDVEPFLKNPEITFAEKCGFIDSVLKEGFCRELKEFLKLLVDKRRIALVGPIVDYIHERYGHGEAIMALVKTCRPLPEDLIAVIQERLESKFKRKFSLHLELDAHLIGGAQIVIGNTIMDGSLRKRLDELREKLETIRLG